MSAYRITNLTPAAIILEDIGVTLQRSGGRDSSCIISADQYESSRSIKEFHSWISAEKIHEASTSSPQPPLSESPPSPILTPIVSTSISVQSTTLGPSEEIVALHATIHEINNRMAQMVELLSRMPSSPYGFDYSNQESKVQAPPIPSPQTNFIPSKILPTEVNTNIHSQDNSNSAEEFDASAAALKNLRKKK